MCMTVKEWLVRWATEDIRVYKILERTRPLDGPEELFSPYMHTRYKLGEVMEVHPERWERILNYRWGLGVINDGALHSYSSYDAALRSGWIDNVWPGREIFEAVIPAGSKYILGTRDEVCSQKLIVQRRAEIKQAVDFELPI